MLFALSLILSCQLAGELITRGAGLPVPGPVVGLALLLAVLTVRPSLIAAIRPTVAVILANLSLFFVPAGVGVVANLEILSNEWIAIIAVLVVSTVLAMLASVATFLAALRILEREAE
ncbi:MAG: putative effector of murein hydrolase LrgA [Rhodobacteraceae bacterium HLUCCO18]|nr:MAG: putative effector of murein hydrolase LrgA [Rhodobacteraceae bacterium HLUCCO18]